jgi:hypothetical protein
MNKMFLLFPWQKRIQRLENELVEAYNLISEQERLIKEMKTELWQSHKREAIAKGLLSRYQGDVEWI